MIQECDTFTKDKQNKRIYDNPELHSMITDLKVGLKKFYIDHIREKMLKYELVK